MLTERSAPRIPERTQKSGEELSKVPAATVG